MDLHGTAEAGDRNLSHIAHRLPILQGSIAGIYATVSAQFHLREGIGIRKTGNARGIRRLSSMLGNGALGQSIGHRQNSADQDAYDQQDSPRGKTRFHGNHLSLLLSKHCNMHNKRFYNSISDLGTLVNIFVIIHQFLDRMLPINTVNTDKTQECH